MKKYSNYLAPIVLFTVFLLDAQISTLLSNLAPSTVSITSHLLLIVGMYIIDKINLTYTIILFSMLGIVYDIYYLNILGISTTLFPLIIYMVYYFTTNVHLNRWTSLMILGVMIFGFEFTSFVLARLFQLTNLSMFIFVVYKLLPSLLYNLFILLIFYPLFKNDL
ncbi:MAG: rod shape-determining protein MreD [Streptococcus orisratti]|uniref:rod shape-determining protein MreD n=1 Tax=Streptococcus orisratti TaxID=114652 RepID=UPI002A90EF8A|nr:rod shape-determining protein MreD [Streptococcus orisratti]MDY5636330.1 rod shape-determining protein MreD [Streptococcus orisratti]